CRPTSGAGDHVVDTNIYTEERKFLVSFLNTTSKKLIIDSSYFPLTVEILHVIVFSESVSEDWEKENIRTAGVMKMRMRRSVMLVKGECGVQNLIPDAVMWSTL
ncbi:uncharacterized, partial [Tachysurus ichikawai]